MRLFWTNFVLHPLKHRSIGKHDTLNRKIAPVTPVCAPEVILGHKRSSAVFFNFWQRRARAVKTPLIWGQIWGQSERCPLGAKPLIWGQIWGHVGERALKELSNALFRGAVALLVPELAVGCSKSLKSTKFDLWWILVTWPLPWP